MKYNATVEELHEEDPAAGDVCWRLLTWVDEDGVACYELYCAEYELEEDGDAENGPHCWVTRGHWHEVGYGLGHADIADMVARYEQDCATEVKPCIK